MTPHSLHCESRLPLVATVAACLFVFFGIPVTPARAAGGYLGGQWFPYCENGYNPHGHGQFTFCINGNTYRIMYSSGTWIQGACGGGMQYTRNLSESEVIAFHQQVCPSRVGTNTNDLIIEMMRMMSQQYNYF